MVNMKKRNNEDKIIDSCFYNMGEKVSKLTDDTSRSSYHQEHLILNRDHGDVESKSASLFLRLWYQRLMGKTHI